MLAEAASSQAGSPASSKDGQRPLEGRLLEPDPFPFPFALDGLLEASLDALTLLAGDSAPCERMAAAACRHAQRTGANAELGAHTVVEAALAAALAAAGDSGEGAPPAPASSSSSSSSSSACCGVASASDLSLLGSAFSLVAQVAAGSEDGAGGVALLEGCRGLPAAMTAALAAAAAALGSADPLPAAAEAARAEEAVQRCGGAVWNLCNTGTNDRHIALLVGGGLLEAFAAVLACPALLAPDASEASVAPAAASGGLLEGEGAHAAPPPLSGVALHWALGAAFALFRFSCPRAALPRAQACCLAPRAQAALASRPAHAEVQRYGALLLEAVDEVAAKAAHGAEAQAARAASRAATKAEAAKASRRRRAGGVDGEGAAGGRRVLPGRAAAATTAPLPLPPAGAPAGAAKGAKAGGKKKRGRASLEAVANGTVKSAAAAAKAATATSKKKRLKSKRGGPIGFGSDDDGGGSEEEEEEEEDGDIDPAFVKGDRVEGRASAAAAAAVSTPFTATSSSSSSSSSLPPVSSLAWLPGTVVRIASKAQRTYLVAFGKATSGKGGGCGAVVVAEGDLRVNLPRARAAAGSGAGRGKTK